MLPLVIIEVAENRVDLGVPGRNEFVGVATVTPDTVFYTNVRLPGIVNTFPAGMYSGPSAEQLVFDVELRKGYADREYNRILQARDDSTTCYANAANAYRFASERTPLNIPGLRLEIELLNLITLESLLLAAYVDTYDYRVGSEWLNSVSDWKRWVANGYPSCYALHKVSYGITAVTTIPSVEVTYDN